MRNREEGLGRCLVGRWDDGSVVETELLSVRKWGERSWNIKNGMKVLSMGGPFMLLEFKDEEEAERVLKRGTERFKDKVLQLEGWSEEAGWLKPILMVIQAYCDGHSSPLWVGPGGVDSRPSLGLKEG